MCRTLLTMGLLVFNMTNDDVHAMENPRKEEARRMNATISGGNERNELIYKDDVQVCMVRPNTS